MARHLLFIVRGNTGRKKERGEAVKIKTNLARAWGRGSSSSQPRHPSAAYSTHASRELRTSVISHCLVNHLSTEEKMNGAGWAAVLIYFSLGNLAWGQVPARSFDELKKELQVGDSVQVTDDRGELSKGKVVEISSTSLLLKGRATALSANSILQVQKRRKDPWWNGTLMGGGIGAAGGLLLAGASCHDDSECSAIAMVAFVPAGAGIGMATGALIDRFVSKYDTVFTRHGLSSQRRLHVSPIISRKQKGLLLSIAF
jgi:hypothetical protein